MDPAAVIQISAGAVSFFICLIILIALIYNIHNAPSNIKPNKRSIRLTYTVIALLIVSTFFFCFNGSYIANFNINVELALILLDGISTIAWNLAQFFVYLLLFERIYHAFNQTKYSVSKYTIIWFTILSVGYLVSSILMYILWSMQSPFSVTEDVFGDVYAIGEEIIDLILSIYLIGIFINKLLQLTIDLNENDSEKYINSQGGALNEQQQRLIDLMTKYFVLSFMATLITQLESLVYCIGYFDDSGWGYWVLYVSWILWPVDCAVNSICLFLIFEINGKWYHKWCKGFHACIKLFFKRATKRKLRKKYFGDQNVELEINLLNEHDFLE